MLYHISRAGQTYGPYTLEDLQRYVASGNILPTDLAKSDAMPEWRPVSEVLGTQTPPQTPPVYTAPTQPYAPYAQPAAYPDPPNLSWALLLLFGILTCGIFNVIYELIQVLWLKSVRPTTKVVIYYVVWVVLQFITTGHSFRRMFLLGMMGMHGTLTRYPVDFFGPSFSIAAFVMVMVYRFSMRSELEEHFNTVDPIGLRLSGIMTFFFGSLYFQYHFNRINDIKRALAYRTGTPL
jgi:hypothetical protein